MAKENIITTISSLISDGFKFVFKKDEQDSFLVYLWMVAFKLIFFGGIVGGLVVILSPLIAIYVVYELFSGMVNGRL